MVPHSATAAAVKTLENLQTRTHVAITLATDYDTIPGVGRALAGHEGVAVCVCHLSARRLRAGPQPWGCMEEWEREERGAPARAPHGKGRLEQKIQESALDFLRNVTAPSLQLLDLMLLQSRVHVDPRSRLGLWV